MMTRNHASTVPAQILEPAAVVGDTIEGQASLGPVVRLEGVR